MDTWFSSWLWPMAVFDTSIFKDPKNNKGNKDLNYYYPTNDLVTAPEILFFWVARMIIAGYRSPEGCASFRVRCRSYREQALLSGSPFQNPSPHNHLQ